MRQPKSTPSSAQSNTKNPVPTRSADRATATPTKGQQACEGGQGLNLSDLEADRAKTIASPKAGTVGTSGLKRAKPPTSLSAEPSCDGSPGIESGPEAAHSEAARSGEAGTVEAARQPLLTWRLVAHPTPRKRTTLSQVEVRQQTQEAFRLASNSGPFEWADIAWDLCDAGQPHAAAAFWTSVLELYDCDARVYLYLADCLSEAGDTERSLDAAARGYRLEPGLYEFQEAVLDRLFDLGRDETTFDWAEPPIVTRLGPTTTNRVFELIGAEGECDLFDLRYTLFDEEYVLFDVEDLAQDLELDERFDVCRFEGAAYASHRLPLQT